MENDNENNNEFNEKESRENESSLKLHKLYNFQILLKMIQLFLVSSSSDAQAETLSSPKKKKSRVYLGMFFGLIVDLSIF